MRFPVGLVLESECDDPSPAYADLRTAIADEHLRVEHPRTGDTYAVGELRLDVLGPCACSEGAAASPSDDSIVIRLTYRDDTVLFPGDTEKPLQQEIFDAGEPVRAEVLKVPHHAGSTSLADFFDAVDPKLAVVSIGRTTPATRCRTSSTSSKPPARRSCARIS